jgi:hypothetical protein
MLSNTDAKTLHGEIAFRNRTAALQRQETANKLRRVVSWWQKVATFHHFDKAEKATTITWQQMHVARADGNSASRLDSKCQARHAVIAQKIACAAWTIVG